MIKKCMKCGAESEFENVPLDPLAECPKCGVIYARAEEAARKAK